MKAAVDQEKLAAALTTATGVASVTLEPLAVACAWPVFKATPSAGAPFFVKLADPANAAQTLAILQAVDDVPFFPKPILAGTPDFDGRVILALEWKASTCVTAEAMSDAQAASFVAGCRALAAALGRYAGPVRPVGEDDPDCQYAALAHYAARHPLAARLIRPILTIPEAARTYRGRSLVTIHGDFQPKNYGFAGEDFAAVFDFDALTTGLACEDVAYAFTERARRAELSAAARARLTELFLRHVSASGWSKDAWRIAVSHARLRIATRRLAKHPDSFIVAFDIARRDKPLAALADALEKHHA